MKAKLIFYIFVLLAVFGAGVFIGKIHYEKICISEQFQYISSQSGCSPPKPVVSKRAYVQLKNDLVKLIEEKTNNDGVIGVSVYFRDLQDGPTLGIDEHTQFSPASLLKLPLLLIYYNLAEDQPDLLERQLVVKNLENNLSQTILPKESVQENTAYSIGDLLKYMIRYSDNRAYYNLLQYLREISPQKDLFKETFVDLGIIDPQDFLDETLSVKSYGSIFVQLYYSSYFDRKETSEAALALLTEVDWNKGINAGVPSGITVAHKFGEREDSEGNLKQLHDCGIVYYPGNPYLLCVMTRGDDFDKLAGVISSISKMVYEEFDSRKLE